MLHRQAYGGGGREAASPMSIFGLSSPSSSTQPLPRTTAGTGTGQRRRLEGALAAARPSTSVMAGTFHDDEVPGGDGYGAVGSSRPAAIQVGDLVLVDEDTGQWATVDEQPEEDFADPGCIALSWRDDDDNCGSLTVPEDTLVPIRRPLEDDPE